MAWEKRQCGSRYFTRSVREDGRVRRQYFGCGIAGHLAAEAEALHRAERSEHEAKYRALQAALNGADSGLKAFSDAVRTMMHARLLARGFHRPADWRWTRRGHERKAKTATA
jgi:hypothetical protein